MDAASPLVARGIGALGPGPARRFDRVVTAGGPSGGPIVEFMAREPGMAERLLAAHVDDGTGHCRVCSAGPQAGRKVWPCPIHEYALSASQQRPRVQ